MSLNAKTATGGGKRGPKQPPIEAGAYPARVVQIIDLGVQDQRAYKGEDKPPAHQMQLTYELVDEFCFVIDEDTDEITDTVDETKPRWISETFALFNLEADLATSTKRYKALDPDMEFEGEFPSLIGVSCMVTVTAKPGTGDKADITYNNVGGVATMRAKQKDTCPELVNEPKVFLLDSPDTDVFNSFPNWIQDKIKENHNYSGSELEMVLASGGNPTQDGPEEASPSTGKTSSAGTTGTDKVKDW